MHGTVNPSLLLADIFEQHGEKTLAVKVYRQSLTVEWISPKAKEYIKARYEAMQNKARTGPRKTSK